MTRRHKSVPVDWAAVRAYCDSIDGLDEGSLVQVTVDFDRFVRFRKFVRENARVRDWISASRAMICVAEDLKLGWFRAARLYIRLQHLASRHGYKKMVESYERAGDPLTDLQALRKPLLKIEQFASGVLADEPTARLKIAETKMEYAAHFWASKVHAQSAIPDSGARWDEAAEHGFELTRHEITARGFEPDPRGPYIHDFASRTVLRTWLRNSILFSKLVSEIIEKEWQSRNQLPADHQTGESPALSAAVNLAGVQLPKIYKELTGKKYGFSTSKDNTTLLNVAGPRFAAMCFPVLGLSTPALETLRKHYQDKDATAMRRRHGY